MANNFRRLSPKRTFTKTYTNYRKYKKPLSYDFHCRCGYTDCSDFWFGGRNNFHIDHFKPFSKNPTLENDYQNLVYCCSYVNILKSDDEGDYIDPCNVNFNNHFERDSDGAIIPKPESKEANYMYLKLQLGLVRYKIIWKLDEIQIKLDELSKQIQDPKNIDIKTDLRVLHSELAEEFTSYISYLKANQY